MSEYINKLLAKVRKQNPSEPEFHQAVEEVVESLEIVLERHPEYKTAKILERMVEPERMITFRVPWMDDQSEIQINRGYRIEMNSAITIIVEYLILSAIAPVGIVTVVSINTIWKKNNA